MGKELRCPSCDRSVPAGSLTYSTSLELFVCPNCRAKERAASEASSRASVPSPGFPDHSTSPTTSAPPPARVSAQSREQARHQRRSSLLFALTLVLQAGIITAGGIYVFSRLTPTHENALLTGQPAQRSVATKPQPEAKTIKPPVAAPRLFDPAPPSAGPRPLFDPAPPVVRKLPSPPAALPAPPVEVPRAVPPIDAVPATPATTTSAPSEATDHAARFVEYPRGPVSDRQIGNAIQLGVDYLLAQFEYGELKLDDKRSEARRQGLDALAVYALAVSSKAIVDQRISPKGAEMGRMLEKLKSYPLTESEDVNTPLTYSRSLRACALATFNRPQDRATLEDDVDWLLFACTAGSYTYDERVSLLRGSRNPRRKPQPAKSSTGPRSAVPDEPVRGARAAADDFEPFLQAKPKKSPADPSAPPHIFTNQLPQRPAGAPDSDFRRRAFPWDNSNSQYGLLGVWAGAEVGCEVPDNFWRLVRRHWESCQLPTGEWSYRGEGRGGT